MAAATMLPPPQQQQFVASPGPPVPGYHTARPNGNPHKSAFGYPQSSTEMGQIVPLLDEPNPVPVAILLNIGGFATAMLMFCTLYNAVSLLQHPLYFYFATSTLPMALLIIVVLCLFWYFVPRLFRVPYPRWESGCCRICPTVPGCCLPGCPTCPSVPGCPSLCQCPPCGLDHCGSMTCTGVCPNGCCGPCVSCCPGLDICCNNPLKAAKVFLTNFKSNTEFILVFLTVLVLLFVWTSILSYFNMGFIDVLPGLRSCIHFITAPFRMLSFSLPENLNFFPSSIHIRIPTIGDLGFVLHGILGFLGAPPLVLLAMVLGTLFLLMLMVSIMSNYASVASKEGVNSGEIWGNAFSIWGTFLLAVGTIFIISGLPIVKEARYAHMELFDGCKTGAKTRNLFVASQALQALRQTPACAKEQSVEHCQGFEETPYIGLLKYMESSFQCSGFCYDASEVPGSLAMAASGSETFAMLQGASLVQTGMSISSGVDRDRHRAANQNVEASSSSTRDLSIPPALFSKEPHLVSCDGMAARDMNIYVGRIGTEIYFQGILLVLLSMGVLFMRLTGIPWSLKGRHEAPPIGKLGAQNYGTVPY